MRKNNTNKKQRSELQRLKISANMGGTGLFLFRNKTNASLQLPKKSSDGKIWVEPNQTWKGDSFFLKMIPREAVLVETIENPNQEKEENKMSEEKLLLDQPEQITSEGTVEHIVSKEQLPINESTSKKKKKTKTESKNKEEKLLTEDPIAGVTIIRD